MRQDELCPIDKFRRANAKRLRKNDTEAEQRLWKALRKLPLDGSHFRRQVPIGPYVADFACLAARVVVELDGSQHGEKQAIVYDESALHGSSLRDTGSCGFGIRTCSPILKVSWMRYTRQFSDQRRRRLGR